jgi:putative endopeptidase
MPLPKLLPVVLLAAAGAAAAADADPCVDFYTYVNQRWLESTELPADRVRVGTFDGLRIGNTRLLQRALSVAAEQPQAEPTPGRRLVATDFAAGMDPRPTEAQGFVALAPWLDRIGAATSAERLPALIGELARLQVAAPFGGFVGADAKDKRRYALYLRQGGLGLPDREDYFDEGERATRLRAAYRVYVRRLLALAGAPADDDALDALLDFEKKLAAASATRVELRDPIAGYNPFRVTTLAAAAPGFDWAAWLQAYAGRSDAPFVVGEPRFARRLGELQREPLAVWRNYLRVRLVDTYARRLGPAVEQAAFEFHDSAVRGLRQPLPRAERVLASIGTSPAAEGLGEVYVALAFSPQAQARALQLVADLRTAFEARIDKLDWMSPETKARARAKLAAIAPKIGMPPAWKRYEGLTLARDDYAGNALRMAAWQTADRLADLDRPVDRARWNTSPHIVNAFAGSLNDIVFPAGILQPPFFDENADDAANYGAIGSIIGHELTHHFDDRGRQFDADGNLADWWSAADAAAYRARADRVAALYGGYEPVPGVRINGRLTLGENISDLSGVQIAYDALQIALKRNGKPLDDSAAARRFFVAYATLWRSKMQVDALVNQLRTDGHSPGPFRVLGPLSNTPAFASAFACKAGQPMAAAEPISVW